MKDKRAIIIKGPQFQSVRDALRDILFQATRLEKRKFRTKWRSFLVNVDGSRRSINDFAPDELDQFRQLQGQENKLVDLVNRSILKCITCGRGNRNMVYNKAYDAWYCTVCYGLGLDHAQELRQERKKCRKKTVSFERKTIEDHSKTFL